MTNSSSKESSETKTVPKNQPSVHHNLSGDDIEPVACHGLESREQAEASGLRRYNPMRISQNIDASDQERFMNLTRRDNLKCSEISRSMVESQLKPLLEDQQWCQEVDDIDVAPF